MLIEHFSEKFILPDFSAQLTPILSAAQAASLKRAELRDLHNSLVHPFFNGLPQAERTDEIMVKVAPPTSVEATIARRMLDYGYCSHYFTGKGIPVLPAESSNPHFRAYTLVATCPCRETPLVLGTLQAVVGNTVPALHLYEPEYGRQLPHLASNGHNGTAAPIGELRRFSVNPLLEAMPALSDDELKGRLKHYRALICNKLYELALQIFRAQHARFVYLIASPQTHRFFSKSGLTLRPLAGMRLVASDEVRVIQTEFAGYWRPEAPLEQQPALYQVLLPPHYRAFASTHETSTNYMRTYPINRLYEIV